MKTLLRNSVVAALALSVCGLFAADGKAAPAQPQVKTAEKAQKGTSWTPFQLVFLPGIPDSSMTSTVYGLKLGIPATGGRGLVKPLKLLSSTVAQRMWKAARLPGSDLRSRRGMSTEFRRPWRWLWFTA